MLKGVYSVALLVLLMMWGFSGSMLKASAVEEPVLIPEILAEVSLDGKLDEPCWQNAARFELPFETEPGENAPAPVQTEVYIFYTKSYLYIGMMCHDPDPSAIRARYSARDQIDGDDLVNINLDTFNDERQNYFFSLNPLGVQRDGTETTKASPSWDTVWKSRARISEKGYILEFAIPFSAIQFHRKDGQKIWGLDISRYLPRQYKRRLGLVKMDRNTNSYQVQFLKIKGFEGIKPGKNLEFIPALTWTHVDSEKNASTFSNFTSPSKKLEPGLTAKWGITPNLFLSGTVNPDFSQVEADPKKLEVNQPFALSYDERRPFFTEGADYFQTPLNIIYTRTMRDPEWGLKLSGKEGKNTIAAYFVRDKKTGYLFPGNQNSYQSLTDDESSVLALRYKRDFGTRYSLGSVITYRHSGDYLNRLYSIDGSARFNSKNRFNFQLIQTHTHYSEDISTRMIQSREEIEGTAIYLSYQYSSRNLNFNAQYQDVSPDFRADLGFFPKVNYRTYSGGLYYKWYKFNSWWSSISTGINYSRTTDHDSQYMGETQEVYFNFSGTMQSRIYVGGFRIKEAYNGKIYNMISLKTNGALQLNRNLNASFSGVFGDRIDYTNNREGKQFQVTTTLTYNLGRHFKITLDESFEKMKSNSQKLYTANITQTGVTYYLNERIFLRGIFQYVDYNYNQKNYISDPPTSNDGIYAQFLFSYRLNPWTVLYLGYTENQAHRFHYSQTLRQSYSTYFFKVSYSWQL